VHLRQAIIAEIKARIFVDVSEFAGRVFTSRVHPFEVLPCASVYWDDEVWSGEGSPGPVQFRELTVNVDIFAKATQNLETALDLLAAGIEPAVFGADMGKLGLLVKLTFLESSTPELVDELEQPTGRLRMVWQVLYRVDTRDPEGGPIP
jgi:hypothetical protein